VLPSRSDKAPGPRPLPDRLCLQGILFVLHIGIGWEDLPQELGFGSGMTHWRRLERWTEVGMFDHVHQFMLANLNAANRNDWSRATMDSNHIDAKRRCRDRPVAGQPRQTRLQASPDLRRQQYPNLRPDLRRQRARHQARPRLARRLTTHRRPPGPATTPLRRTAGR
jgi:transposase